jgi:hypothetical protein
VRITFLPGHLSRGRGVTLIGWPGASPLPVPVDSIIEPELDNEGVNRYCNAYPVPSA